MHLAGACFLLLLVYLALSLLNDPHGFLGTDTGAKVATLNSIERHGELDPDVGYWAEQWDPDGRVHPLYTTAHLEEKWVVVTTLPALYLGYPLFALGGYRAALLIPMLGSVLAALAARALARRLLGQAHGASPPYRTGDTSTGPDRLERHQFGEEEQRRAGDLAFWVVGLASPLAVYALDFWEHSLGVALMAWGVVMLLDVATGRPDDDRRAHWGKAAAAGLSFGGAATMRTEALVYTAVAAAVSLGWLAWSRRARGVGALTRPVVAGLALMLGLALPLLANYQLEQSTIGTGLRNSRAAGAVGLAVADDDGPSRVEESLLTLLSPFPSFDGSSYLYGAALLGLLGLAALGARRPRPEQSAPRVAGAGAAAVYAVRMTDGLGFVPGLVPTTPMAAAGLATGHRLGTPARLVSAIAVLSLPLVWALQYTGGAAPQWGGRYILTTGLLLGVVGVASLSVDGVARWARVGGIALAAAITAFGLAWLSVRSHDAASASAALAHRPEPVLVSRVAHLFREAGSYYQPDRHWLTVRTAADEQLAARIGTESGASELGVVELVELARLRPRPDLPGYAPVRVDTVRYFSSVDLQVTVYRRSGANP